MANPITNFIQVIALAASGWAPILCHGALHFVFLLRLVTSALFTVFASITLLRFLFQHFDVPYSCTGTSSSSISQSACCFGCAALRVPFLQQIQWQAVYLAMQSLELFLQPRGHSLDFLLSLKSSPLRPGGRQPYNGAPYLGVGAVGPSILQSFYYALLPSGASVEYVCADFHRFLARQVCHQPLLQPPQPFNQMTNAVLYLFT